MAGVREGVDVSTRAHRIREIIGHLDALVDDLDGSDHKCGECGLAIKDNWTEAQAKTRLTESRKKFAKMLGEGWAKQGEDDETARAANAQMNRRKAAKEN